MPRRTLVQHRPFLLLSIAAALAFFYLRVSDLPELYLIPLKGSAVGLLAIYAFVRHSGPDARLYCWALGAAALGDMAIEIDLKAGAMLFFLHHALALGMLLRHRRAQLSKSQSWLVGMTLILTPLIAWLLPYDESLKWDVGLYAITLGAMAAGAWASDFPRYRVGAGAMLFVISDLLIFAGFGPLSASDIPEYLVWPIYYLGMFLMCTGVIQTLRKRDPELRVVH